MTTKIACLFLIVLQKELLTVLSSKPQDLDYEYGIQFTDEFDASVPSPDWESLVFWLANGVGYFGRACRHHSQYYCLDAYHTQAPTFSFSEGENLAAGEIPLDMEASKAWFGIMIKEIFKEINMINYQDPSDCCEVQTLKYLKYGLRNKHWSPDTYMYKISSYHNESKPLNLISAVYVPKMCINMVMDVGFGPGTLRRDHHISVVEGAPYVILGRGFGNLGSPEMDSATFDYWNVTSELTFHWFKHNIMCKGNPWICEFEDHEIHKIDKKENEKGQSKKDKKASGGGSKKSRRKNQKGKGGASTSKSRRRMARRLLNL